MNKAIFFDRDGVINKVITRDNGHKGSPRNFGEFYVFENVKNLIKELKKLFFLNIVFTNQPEVSRGLLNIIELEKMHQLLRKDFLFDDIFACLHDDHHNCECRKPKPGMLLKAAKKWDIDLTKSFVVGDRNKDIKSGKSAGCKTILLDTGYNNKDIEINADFKIKSLLQIIDILN